MLTKYYQNEHLKADGEHAAASFSLRRSPGASGDQHKGVARLWSQGRAARMLTRGPETNHHPAFVLAAGPDNHKGRGGGRMAWTRSQWDTSQIPLFKLFPFLSNSQARPAPKPSSAGTNKCLLFKNKSMKDQDKFLRKSQSVSLREMALIRL